MLHSSLLRRQCYFLNRQKRWKCNAKGDKNVNPSASSTTKSDMTTMVTPKAFAIGTVAGVLGSLAGMGGGFVMIPLMTSKSLLRLSQHQAHGTSLFAVAATGMAGALSYSGHVDWEAAAAVAACGMVTARFGAIATTKLSGQALKKSLGVFMLCVAPLVPAKAYLVEHYPSRKDETNPDMSTTMVTRTTTLETKEKKEWSLLPERWIVPGLIGCGSGFLAGLFGVGGGAVVVPALTVMTDMTHYQALGTSLCAMSLPAIVGTATHYSKGNVSMRVAPVLAIGAFAGAFAGGKLGQNTNENTLRWGFSGLMTFLGLKTLIRA